MKKSILSIALSLCTVGSAKTFVSIGTGGMTGVYYPTGASICQMINKSSKELRCTVESTGGSVYNANSLESNALDVGIIQSDVVYLAKEGKDNFTKKSEKIRSLFSIYTEPLTLVARKDANIKTIFDLKGKHVNVGNAGSGQRRTVETLFKACDIKMSELKSASDLKASEMPDAMKDKKIDAYFYVVGHPTANIKDISATMDINIVPVEGPCVDKLIKDNPYFVRSVIPGGLYKGSEKDTVSFGVTASLMTSTKLNDQAAYEIVKTVFDNLDAFKKLHPSYKDISHKSMLEGLTAPLHVGAQKFFNEKGLAK